ncbi:helix-turn-helix domain-containing protein [Flavobacterium sp. 2]|uniref:helix-turn-helix domain-containing protein n=1 Tax=Flavobacterium sp. 2 TaxID=308053 RepID=UPI003CEF1FD8
MYFCFLPKSRRTVSAIENSETIDDEKLQAIAKILGVTVEGIKNFSEEAVLNIIGNTINNHDNASSFNYSCSFNPLDKMVELFERLVQAEKDKVEYLEKLLKGK